MKRVLQFAALVVLLVAVVAYRAVVGDLPALAPEAAVTASPGAPLAAAAAPSPQAAQAAAGQTVAQPSPVSVAPAKPPASPAMPDGSLDIDRARITRDATWTPGQLQLHFEKHGREGPWASESVYDASARETIESGTAFTYVDRESNAERLGFFDKGGNRFTSLTRDGRRITTHFRPDRGEAYVRNLYRSTYR